MHQLKVNAEYIGDIMETTLHIAHESVHAVAGPRGRSIWEEVTAFQFENWVSVQIGYDKKKWEDAVSVVDLSLGYSSSTLENQLGVAKQEFEPKYQDLDLKPGIKDIGIIPRLRWVIIDPYLNPN